MKNPAQIIVLIVLLVWGFWIGIQWGQVSREKKIQQQLDAIIAERSKNNTVTNTTNNTPVTTPTDTTTNTTTNTSSSVTPTPTEVVPATTVTPVETTTPQPTTSSPVTANVTQTLNPNEKVIRYENKSFGYSFDIPANVYYSGFAGEAGAIHAVGIKKEASPETLVDASVRVYYYGKKVIPELQNATNNMYQDPAGKYIAVLVNGTHSIKIESADLNSPIIARIMQTITVSN